MKKEIKGLGDLVESITEVTGIKTVVEKTTEFLGIEDCGCNRRQEVLNKLVPYNNIETTSQNEEDFKYGIYIFVKNSIINGYQYKINDKIIIDNNELLKQYKELYKLGVIIKELK